MASTDWYDNRTPDLAAADQFLTQRSSTAGLRGSSPMRPAS